MENHLPVQMCWWQHWLASRMLLCHAAWLTGQLDCSGCRSWHPDLPPDAAMGWAKADRLAACIRKPLQGLLSCQKLCFWSLDLWAWTSQWLACLLSSENNIARDRTIPCGFLGLPGCPGCLQTSSWPDAGFLGAERTGSLPPPPPASCDLPGSGFCHGWPPAAFAGHPLHISTLFGTRDQTTCQS